MPGTQPPQTEPPDASGIDQVRSEWLRRIEAEYHSAACTQHLALWLTQLGAPPEIIQLALRIAADELDHAQLCADVYREAGGQGAPLLTRESLCLPRSAGEPLELDVLRVAVEQFCLGETVAVRIFSRMRAQATTPCVRRALARILRDEVVHRDFGWTLLEWLLTTPMADRFMEQLRVELPAMTARLRAGYGGLALEHDGMARLEARQAQLPASLRAWGLLSALEYLEAFEETVARDYRPRFAELQVPLAPG
ncbi:MAG: hypothetical protein JWN48_3356 [Myxococcaceae bacterium]|nr:hypothetical protein [Myxococcaceae bacterium]